MPSIAAWAPGRMTIALDPAPTESSYLLVSENWYKDWHAHVDADTAPVLRGDQSLIVVPLRVQLAFEAHDFETGKRITWISLLALLVMAAVPVARRRAGTAS